VSDLFTCADLAIAALAAEPARGRPVVRTGRPAPVRPYSMPPPVRGPLHPSRLNV
jgi:hypothetical protein